MDRADPVRGSIRHTLPPWLSAAHTAPPMNAMPAGEPPALTFRTPPVTGSTRARAPPRSPTQTLPALTGELAEKVRAARRDQGASIAALARAHGVSRSAVRTALADA